MLAFFQDIDDNFDALQVGEMAGSERSNSDAKGHVDNALSKTEKLG